MMQEEQSSAGVIVTGEEDDQKDTILLPRQLRRFFCCFRFLSFYIGSEEPPPTTATGLVLDSFGRGVLVMSVAFMGPVLLKLATEEVEDNDGRVYGFKPSSLLTNMATVSGLLSTWILPYMGAIVDHHAPHHRFSIGWVSALLLVLVKAMECIISPSTWFAVAVLQVFSVATFNVHHATTYAYTSELTSGQQDTNGLRLAKYNTLYKIIVYVACLLFLFVVVLLSFLLKLNDVGTARTSQITASLIGGIFLCMAWSNHLFPKHTITTATTTTATHWCWSGFGKIYETTCMIRKDHADIMWLMVSIVFSDAANSALATIVITFMSQVIRLSSSEVGVLMLLMLLACMVGSKLGEYVSQCLGTPIKSAMCCGVWFVVVTTTASLLLQGPSQRALALYVYGPLWGITLGWSDPMHSTIFMNTISKSNTLSGKRVEMMGVYIFCGTLLAWLPTMVFTILNENGVPVNLGLMSLSIYSTLSFFALGIMLNIVNKQEQVEEEDEDLDIIIMMTKPATTVNGERDDNGSSS